MLIGVFDSGVGGAAVAAELRKLLPEAQIISVNDHAHVPYGSKSPEEVIELTKAAIQPLLMLSCNAIVIACNTATTVAISSLRESYPGTYFIGIEPMVKPATQLTKTKRIAVCATPRTLQSARYQELKRRWADGITVIEPDCTSWATEIENGHLDKVDVETTVTKLLQQSVDVIVLGCTHYHLIRQRFVDAAGDGVTVLQPTDAIAARITHLVGQSA